MFIFIADIMVATGYNSGVLDDTEVIDTDTTTSCSNMSSIYPLEVGYAVSMQHDSKMVICGGYLGALQRTSDCYRYSNDSWTIEAFKLEPDRYGAMSVEIRSGEWLVMGGLTDGSSRLSDTQLLKDGIFLQGPELPEPIEGGSSVMLNETHLFVAAGQYQSSSPTYSPRSYLLDINTEQWTPIADRTPTHSSYHSSGKFWNSTAGELQIANVGVWQIEVYSPSDNVWHKVPFPSPLTYFYQSAAIQKGNDSFILIGGETNVDSESGNIYLFNETGLSILEENVLQVPRSAHVAMPISKEDFSCF